MLHQMPFKPKDVWARTIARGILSPVNTIPTREGGTVLPSPWKVPADAASVHINSWDTPNILR